MKQLFVKKTIVFIIKGSGTLTKTFGLTGSLSTKSDSNLIRLGICGEEHTRSMDSMRSSLEAEVTCDAATTTCQSSWSVSPNSVQIRRCAVVGSDGSGETRSFSIRNHLNRKPLSFDVKFNAEYLSVEPQHGVVQPLQAVELLVRPSFMPHETWIGTVTIWCNQVNRDVQVIIEPSTDHGLGNQNYSIFEFSYSF